MTFRRAFFLLNTAGLLAVAAGCRDSHSHDAEHGHAHGEEARTAQITAWTDRYEVFAEHHVPVVGRPTTFITHVTDLHTLEPRRAGAVKLILRQGDVVSEHAEAAPTRPGIYLPEITFPKAGDWQVTLLIPVDGTNASIKLGGLKVYADQHAADHADIPEAPDGVSFSKEQQWKILSRTEAITKRRLVERVRVAAQVRAKPGFSATITAPVSGQLVAPDDQTVPYPGQHVEAGQLLALLKPNFSEAAAKAAEAMAEFTTAKAALEQAETAYSRVKQLAAEQAKSPRELQEAELTYQSAKARHAAAAGLLATFSQAGAVTSSNAPLLMELRAPIAGVINSIAAGPGEMVAASQSVFTVLNPKSVWIEARIPEATLPRIATGSNASVERPGQPNELLPITEEGRGKLVSLGLEVDVATRTVPLIFETANRDNQFRIGQQVTLHVETANAQDGLAIPVSALVEEGGWFIAFVQVAGETFQKRELRLGIRDGEWVQVLSGVSEGERVVMGGAYAIRLSTATGAIPAHGHAH